MIIGDVNYVVIDMVFLVAFAILAIVPSVLSFASHGKIIGESTSVRLCFIVGAIILALACMCLLAKSHQNINALNDIVFLIAFVMLAIVPFALSFASNGSRSVRLCFIVGAIILGLAYMFTLHAYSVAKSHQNIDVLNNHYGITISTNSGNTTTGLLSTESGEGVLPGNSSQSISFTDHKGKLVNGTLVINGNKATVYYGSGSSMKEYVNK